MNAMMYALPRSSNWAADANRNGGSPHERDGVIVVCRCVSQGKLIILFQLLLPEIPSSSYGLKRLTLLLVMSALAPIIAWASGLVQRRATVHNPGDFVIR